MERWIYLDGRFFDRVSNSAAQMAHSLDAEIITVKRERHAGFGMCERVELKSRSQRVTEKPQGRAQRAAPAGNDPRALA